MRRLRLVAALFALPLMTAACIGAAQLPDISSTGATASQASSSQSGDGGGGGGGANGSITYRISGDYSKSGELPFVPLGLSLFADGGWVAWFADETGGTDNVIQLNSNPDTAIVNFGNSEISIIGTEDTGCTFDFSKNDASGLTGTFDCHGAVAVSTDDGAQRRVDMSGEWDAHP